MSTGPSRASTASPPHLHPRQAEYRTSLGRRHHFVAHVLRRKTSSVETHGELATADELSRKVGGLDPYMISRFTFFKRAIEARWRAYQ